MSGSVNNRILVVGGTGVFGKRLVMHLAAFHDIELFASSRSLQNASDFVSSIQKTGNNTQLHGIGLDHTQNFASILRDLKPSIVIDCSGPFQSANFNVARSTLEAGAHHIDLADASGYLRNYSAELNILAVQNGKTGMTGASSTPTLSACVVEHLTGAWQRVDSIDICITPGGKSEVGHSVIEAIMSYAGRDINTWREGKLGKVKGWVGSRVVDVPNLGKRRIAPVETMDAEYLGPKNDVCSNVSFSAGLESSLEQRGLQSMAWLRKHLFFPHPKHFIPMLLKARRLTRFFTSDEGGMLVLVRGIDKAGKFSQSKWSLLAQQDHGPSIPILPAAAAVRKLINFPTTSGAFIASEQLELSDIEREMTPYQIGTHTNVMSSNTSIFQSYLGPEKFQALPATLQSFHKMTAPPVWLGYAQIKGPTWFGPKILASIFGFPQTGDNVPVTVSVERSISQGTETERWTRNFSGKTFESVLCHQADGTFTEKFGPFVFTLEFDASPTGIKMPIAAWKLGNLPLPRFFAPKSVTREYEDAEGRFRFDVRLTIPVLGLLAHYQGYLKPNTGV